MSGMHAVRIFESELHVIADETLDYPSIETGGNLYGLLSHGRTPVIWLATRPAGNVHRRSTSLELDPQVHNLIMEFAWEQYGVQSLGMWHSHHQIGLFEPSEGDRRRTANFAAKWDQDSYVEILCNLPRTGAAEADEPDDDGEDGPREGGSEDGSLSRKERKALARKEKPRASQASHGRHPGPVLVAPFMYTDAPRLVRADAQIEVLPGVSPLRTALAGASLPGELVGALRAADGSPDHLRYELHGSLADGGRGQPQARRPDGLRQLPAADPQGPSHEPVTPKPIPDMERYLECYVVPLLAAHPDYAQAARLVPEGSKKIVLTISSQRSPAEFLLVLGWDGAAPVTLSCAITSGYGQTLMPTHLNYHDLRSNFTWGIQNL